MTSELDATAYRDFSVLFGPILRDHLVRKEMPASAAERLAADSINIALGKLQDELPEPEALTGWTLAIADRCHRAWQLQQDLEDAAVAQQALMPSARPVVPGLEVYFTHRPVRIVTGDFCEVRTFSDGRTAISLGDARGKGAPAALYSALAHSWLRAFSTPDLCPVQLLTRLDTALKELRSSSRYLTLLHSVWHPRTLTFSMCSGGAPAPVLLRAGQLSWIPVPGPYIGWPLPAAFESVELPVCSGDLLVFYSDGIPDQTNAGDETYGDERLACAVAGLGHLAPEDAGQSILADNDDFRGGKDQFDDQMLLVVRVK